MKEFFPHTVVSRRKSNVMDSALVPRSIIQMVVIPNPIATCSFTIRMNHNNVGPVETEHETEIGQAGDGGQGSSTG
jgi:hypothetical protein